jgi:hypothetical protein
LWSARPEVLAAEHRIHALPPRERDPLPAVRCQSKPY